MKSNFILLSIVVCFFLINRSYADQKQLVGADVDYGEHLFGECVTCHNSTKLAKLAIKNKADYLALGAFNVSRTKKTRHKADLKLLKKVKKLTNVPIVAIGGINSDNYKKLLLNKANFLAISGYIWNNKKLKPIEAIKKIR